MNRSLHYLKLIHTIIWLMYVTLFAYIAYAGITNTIDWRLWAAIGAVIVEGIILLLFKWRCPLTIIGTTLTDDNEIGFDIYLPRWLAKNNKSIFTVIFFFELLLISYRLYW